MKHLQEQDLILYHYGEAEDERAMQQHLNDCDSCRLQLEQLDEMLQTMDQVQVPPRDAAYEQRLWRKLKPEIQDRARFSLAAWLRPAKWGPALALAMMLTLAFLAGRYTGEPTTIPDPAFAQRQMLLTSLSDHLDRTRLYLTDLKNEDGQDQRPVLARNLVEDNRLYLEAAHMGGEQELASFLEEMELTLLDLAHRRGPLSISVLQEEKANHAQIIFKIDVYGSDLRQKQQKNISGSHRETMI